MLEPYEGKLSRAVLRGEGGSNTPDLPDDYYGQLAERERRPIEARKKVREGSYTVHSCAHGLGPVWTATPYRMVRIHLCTYVSFV